ncbi:hypothetical protein [Siccirubricoccus sp. G192]|uniref:hypothetical protein n=1 Tax=Siccirubricoccus sp. G192 TaxID=2849651 RepID=UPI001C2C850C|nr:hypothetical protein [Siccirubricoccus sp. G192]MBV1799805.1 hypothetical protein [Siccirubricoccus sp. G192]
MTDRLVPTRRGLLLGAAAATLPGRAGAMLPATAKLLVPGPEDGPLARWSERLAAALARGATSAVSLERSVLGGADGVTAANRFATQAAPDGRTLLVLPGAAAQARLVGDPRARFDAAGWLPVCAMQGIAVVAGRGFPAAGAPLRLGLPAADAPGAAALLGLDLLGVTATPVLGLSPDQAEAALAQGAVEAILLQGAEVPARLAALQARPWFTLDAAGARDSTLPETPALPDLAASGAAPPSAPLWAAFHAAAAAARLRAALVLPALTPANLVALWRGAAQRWQEEESRAGLPAGLRIRTGAEAAPLLAALVPPAAATLAYRDWLRRRLNWRPE